MVDRIREILSRYQLTPTQFADAIGTARPIVSHILSGRNKPSLEVVQKIVVAFPDLSLPWLLSGSGAMEAGAAAVALPRIEAEQPTVPFKATERPVGARLSSKRASTAPQTVIDAPAPVKLVTINAEVGERNYEPGEASAPSPLLANSPISEPIVPPVPIPLAAEIAPPVVGPTVTASSLQAIAEPGKVIRRIVIFYSDGTFSDYQPEIR